LSVFRGLPCGSEGLRGERNWTDADDDFLDRTPARSLSLYEGRRESVESSWPVTEADAVVVVLGAAEVLLEGATSSLRRVSCPPVALPSDARLESAMAGSKYPFDAAWDRGDTSESGLRAAWVEEDASFPFLFSAIAGGRSSTKQVV